MYKDNDSAVNCVDDHVGCISDGYLCVNAVFLCDVPNGMPLSRD